MVKHIFFIVLITTLLFTSCSKKPSKLEYNNINTITEIVVYRIKAERLTAYANISEQTTEWFKMQSGFVSRRVLQDPKDTTLFTDIIEWRTLQNAVIGMQKAQKEATVAPYFDAIEQIVDSEHLSNVRCQQTFFN